MVDKSKEQDNSDMNGDKAGDSSFRDTVLTPTLRGLAVKVPIECTMYPLERYKRHIQNNAAGGKQLSTGQIAKRIWESGPWKGVGGILGREICKFHRYPIISQGGDVLLKVFPNTPTYLVPFFVAATSATFDIGVSAGERVSTMRAKPEINSYKEVFNAVPKRQLPSHLMVGAPANWGKQFASSSTHLLTKKPIDSFINETFPDSHPFTKMVSSSIGSGFFRTLVSQSWEIPKSVQQMNKDSRLPLRTVCMQIFRNSGMLGFVIPGFGPRMASLTASSLAYNFTKYRESYCNNQEQGMAR